MVPLIIAPAEFKKIKMVEMIRLFIDAMYHIKGHESISIYSININKMLSAIRGALERTKECMSRCW